MLGERTVTVAFVHDGHERDPEWDVQTCHYLVLCGATDENSHVFFETIDQVADGKTISTVVMAEIPWHVYRKMEESGLRCGFTHDGVRFMEGMAVI